MSEHRLNILSIAGLDPSGNAGLLADVSVFTEMHLRPMAVATALTGQNDVACFSVQHVDLEQIKSQLQPLLESYTFKAVKIGLCENLSKLMTIVNFIRSYQSEVFIVWDPVLAASSGKSFMEKGSKAAWLQVLKEVDLLTPNAIEIKVLEKELGTQFWNDESIFFRNLLLKGGHQDGEQSIDVLYRYQKEALQFASERVSGVSMRGSGCRLSSFIAAFMCTKNNVETAVALAKNAMDTKFLALKKQIITAE